MPRDHHDQPETPAPDPVQLGDVLRTAREGHGLSIRQVAARAGLHHAGLARIELGRQHPTPATLQALAVALELGEADLFALAGYRLPEGLPSFPAYLRAKYRLPEAATRQLNDYFGYVAKKYKISLDGDANAAPPPQKK